MFKVFESASPPEHQVLLQEEPEPKQTPTPLMETGGSDLLVLLDSRGSSAGPTSQVLEESLTQTL